MLSPLQRNSFPEREEEMSEEDISVPSENSVYKTDVWSVFSSRTVSSNMKLESHVQGFSMEDEKQSPKISLNLICCCNYWHFI